MKIKVRKAICIFSIISIFTIILLFTINYRKINKIYLNKNAEESQKSITFQVYSNENNILKILVTAKDEQNGIKKLIYFSEDGTQKEVECYGKTQVAIDYEVKQNGEYEFTTINNKNEENRENLVVDDNYRNSLIPISVTTEKKSDINGKVTINFPENNKATKMYKIGENGTWIEYKGEFTINSYDIIEKNLKNNDTKKVDIYAKMEDDARNVVQIKKEIENIDVDIEKPQINIVSVDKYPTITADGVINNCKISINYYNIEGISNYYSIDNGNTWIEYNGDLKFNNVTKIMAKSVKNESLLELTSKEDINPSANDAIGAYAYDDDTNTNYSFVNSVKYMLVDNSAIGKRIYFSINPLSLAYGMQATIKFIDLNGNKIEKTYNSVYSTNYSIVIPNETEKMEITVIQQYNMNNFRIDNIKEEKTYLYDTGNEFESITGGWNIKYTGGTNESIGTATKESTGISLRTWGTWCGYGAFTTNKIDLTDVKKIYIQIEECSKTGTEYDDVQLIIGDNYESLFKYINIGPGIYSVIIDENTKGLNTVGIAATNGGNVKVKSIWLEK